LQDTQIGLATGQGDALFDASLGSFGVGGFGAGGTDGFGAGGVDGAGGFGAAEPGSLGATRPQSAVSNLIIGSSTVGSGAAEAAEAAATAEASPTAETAKLLGGNELGSNTGGAIGVPLSQTRPQDPSAVVAAADAGAQTAADAGAQNAEFGKRTSAGALPEALPQVGVLIGQTSPQLPLTVEAAATTTA